MIISAGLALKCARRFLSGGENVEDPMHAHKLENRADLLRHAAEL
jgi:hypothetical protein